VKKSLLIAAIALACAVATPRVSAQSAMFTYTGVPAGPVAPGSSFTIGINVVITTGGNLGNIQGLSYWLYQASPGGPFPFAITNRDLTGSLFSVGGNLVYPLRLDPIVLGDLGQILPTGLPGLPSGTYFLANLTFSVASDSVPGSYTIRNTTNTTPGVGGRISVFNDDQGDTAPIAASPFTISVVPEPSSIALMVIGAVGAGLAIYGQRRALGRGR
jgi:hypothetical protein